MGGDEKQQADRRMLEEAAALGCLFNAISHEVNNQLTNLLLGADHAQAGGGADALAMVVQQAQRIAELCRMMQKMGQGILLAQPKQASAARALTELIQWRRRDGHSADVLTDDGDGLHVPVGDGSLLLALFFFSRWGEVIHPGGMVISARKEDVARSAWAKPGDTVPMVVVRLRRGNPSPTEDPAWRPLVDRFWESPRSMAEIEAMAAWEVLRKARAKVKVCGGSSAGHEVIVMLPQADPA